MTAISDAPPTQGVKYAGSKLRLLPHILALVRKTGAKTVLDGFSGTTRVSQALAGIGCRVISNDIAVWSKTFASCYLLNRKRRETYAGLIAHLNALQPKDGWFTEHYGGPASGGGAKKPWQLHNTRKLDAIRERIDDLCLSPVEEAVAVTSLILALDRVDNTLGHFVSYLKDWSPRSFKPLHLEAPLVSANHAAHEVFCGDVFDVAGADADLAYYDPPYGSNNEKMPPSRVRYAAYYHPWTTVCLNDRPELFGKAMRRKDTSDTVAPSVFEEFRRDESSGRFVALEAVGELLRRTRARWILLSYGSGGRATADELERVVGENGVLADRIAVDSRRNVMAQMKWTNDWARDAAAPNREFLFLIKKRGAVKP